MYPFATGASKFTACFHIFDAIMSADGEKLDVLMIGTGEYTTGYVGEFVSFSREHLQIVCVDGIRK